MVTKCRLWGWRTTAPLMISVVRLGGASCHLSSLPCKYFNGFCALHEQILCARLKWNTGHCPVDNGPVLSSGMHRIQSAYLALDTESASTAACYGLLQCSLSEVLSKVATQVQPRVKPTKVMMCDRSSPFYTLANWLACYGTCCQLVWDQRAAGASDVDLLQPTSPAVTDVTDISSPASDWDPQPSPTCSVSRELKGLTDVDTAL